VYNQTSKEAAHAWIAAKLSGDLFGTDGLKWLMKEATSNSNILRKWGASQFHRRGRMCREGPCAVLKNKLESNSAEGGTSLEYIAYLHKEKGSDYGVSFPDFPGCITAGSSLEEARKMAAEALALHIAGMREDGEPVPDASTLDDLRADPAIKDAVAFLVEVSEPEKTVRINITAREGEIAEIDRRAQAARLTRSAYMVRRSLQAPARDLPGITVSKRAAGPSESASLRRIRK
jgi:predicted RNase H-like HicB family nuclease